MTTCLYTYIYMHVQCVMVYIYYNINKYTYIHPHSYIYVYVYIHTPLYTCMYIEMSKFGFIKTEIFHLKHYQSDEFCTCKASI